MNLAGIGRRLEDWLGQRWVGGVLLAILAGIYLHAYWHHPLNPGSAPAAMRTGWWSWADQFAYWQSAAELAQGKVTAGHYHYPLGYPLLAAPFIWFMPGHAFLVPNLLLVLGAGLMGWRLARCWLDRRLTLLAAVTFLWLHGGLLALTQVVPWNTLATQFTLLAGLWVMVTMQGRRTVGWLTGLAVLTQLVRPGDAMCFAPMLVWAVWRLPGWKERVLAAAGGLAALALTALAVGLVNRAVHGTWDTPYERMTWEAVGFFAYPALHKACWLLVDGRPFFGETDTAILCRYPWLLLALPGAVLWVRRQGMTAVAALAALAMSWILYLNYNDFLPSDVFRYSLIHYLTWTFIPLFGLAVAALRHGWRDRAGQVTLAVTAVLALLVTGLQLEPRELPAKATAGQVAQLPAVRPLWIRFEGESLEKVSLIRLDDRPLQEARDYQIPYVPSDLRLMLSSRSRGSVLNALPTAGLKAVPTVGDFTWGWKWEPARWRLAGRE